MKNNIMKQEQKELLLQDLCTRLPYGVKCSFGVDDAIYEVCGVNPTCCGASEIQATHVKSGINGDFSLSSCKPYLLPLSSMTEEQHKEFYDKYCWSDGGDNFEMDSCSHYYALEKFDWLLKNHFDYRGLIEKGLAIDCTNLNIY